MEQQQQKTTSRSMSKIMKFLPRATSSVSFQNPPLYSPKKEKKLSEKTHNKSNLGKGFSGPLVTLVVPSENRRKLTKNDPTFTLKFEPTSPRVSCMGQVKCKHYRKAAGAMAKINNKPTPNKVSRATSYTPERTYNNKEIIDLEKADNPVVVKNKKNKLGNLRSIFGSSRKSDATNNKSKTDNYNSDVIIPKGPCLSTMKRFSSGRDAFTNFDWTTQVAPLDEKLDRGSDDEVEVKMPSSAPVIVRNNNIGVCDNFVRIGGVSLEPRKEINLWKRRTMAQPQPLQLHVN
uniref:uncharacterized protein At1g76070-like n=1 Tax=Erigeron canadensis TaxID=72917 RepID=UPI001CB93D82|nr:uncharacterized protein At1g76070-like [Erigeron canadensis]